MTVVTWNFPTEPSVKGSGYQVELPKKEASHDKKPKKVGNLNQAEKKGIVSIIRSEYVTMEIIPSKITSNDKVQWLMADIARLYKPFFKRVDVSMKGVKYEEGMGVWWEILYTRDSIRFFITIPNKEFIREGLKHSLRKCWAQSTVREIGNPIPQFPSETTSVTKLTLKNNSVLSLDTSNPQYSPLDSFLNTKHYLGEGDYAIFQVSLLPYGEEWQATAREMIDQIKKEKGVVPKKRTGRVSAEGASKSLAWGMGVVVEELLNMVGDVFVPGWVEGHDVYNSRKDVVADISQATAMKARREAFKTNIRMAVCSKDEERRKSILRALSSGFDPLAGNNEFVEVTDKNIDFEKELMLLQERKFTRTSDVLCSMELSKIVNVPDRKAQMEHQEELKIETHRAETPVPKEVFEEGGIPFALYADSDGKQKTVCFPTNNLNLLCMPRVFIGEPGTGKTTAGVNFAIESFFKGYGSVYIDAADGAAVQRLVSMVPPHMKDKVVVLDFKNRNYPIGLGFSEAFTGEVEDAEEVIAEEVIAYIELNGKKELSMTSARWVSLSSKTVFKDPTSSLGDMLRALRDREYCQTLMDNLQDHDLQREWDAWWNMDTAQRDALFNSAFYRIYKIANKRLLKNIFFQPPKTDEEGDPIVNFRKWMDEGYLVLVKVNETLGEDNVTAIVSFLLAKFNIAVISREDLTSRRIEPNPCFLILDEPDHYIKGSERWRNMLTRYRKYRCGLTFLFHGWEQLKEADRDLPKMMRKAGPHYVIFNTDEANLESLRFVYEPEYEMKEVAKGIPQFHAIIRLKMYDKEGGVTPAFMAKAISDPEKRFKVYENEEVYQISAERYGRPKEEVEEMVHDITTPDIIEEEGDSKKQGDDSSERKVRAASRPRNIKGMGRGEFIELD